MYDNQQHTVRKTFCIPVFSRDVTYQTLPGGNNDVIYKLFPPRESLASDIPYRDGIKKLSFLTVQLCYYIQKVTYRGCISNINVYIDKLFSRDYASWDQMIDVNIRGYLSLIGKYYQLNILGYNISSSELIRPKNIHSVRIMSNQIFPQNCNVSQDQCHQY